VYCNLPAAGLVCRATLEIGRRAVAAGRIAEVEHATEARVAELAALLEGDGAPSAVDLADRHSYRLAHTVNDIPAVIGEPAGEPLPLDWLPVACRTLMTAMQPIQEIREEDQTNSARSVSGIVAGSGTYDGPACLVLGPDEFDKIQRGDVLVTASTNPTFSVLLPRVGAIVTDHGGVLSHAAIIARESGVPAVVGCGTATQVFRDGDRVRVDAETGTVRLLS
jgi:pyruvate,water dikinase